MFFISLDSVQLSLFQSRKTCIFFCSTGDWSQDLHPELYPPPFILNFLTGHHWDHVTKAGIKHVIFLPQPSRVLGVQECATTLRHKQYFCVYFIITGQWNFCTFCSIFVWVKETELSKFWKALGFIFIHLAIQHFHPLYYW